MLPIMAESKISVTRPRSTVGRPTFETVSVNLRRRFDLSRATGSNRLRNGLTRREGERRGVAAAVSSTRIIRRGRYDDVGAF